MTTVLSENAASIIILGAALGKSKKFITLTMLVEMITFCGFDWVLMTKLSPSAFMEDHMFYYWGLSIFFLCMMPIFYLQYTKLSRLIACMMLIQSVLCFGVAVNGQEFNEITMVSCDWLYLIHQWFNDSIWIVECIVAWIAAVSSKERI